MVAGKEKVIPHYLKQLKQLFESEFNWLDLPVFLVGIFLMILFFWIFLRKRRKKTQEAMNKITIDYEKQIRMIKKNHIREIRHMEEMMKAFKEKLSVNKMDTDYQLFELQQERAVLLKEGEAKKKPQMVQEVQEKNQAKKSIEIFELKREITMLRKRQIKEIEGFEKKIQELEKEIQDLHEAHAEEIEKSELEITDLRKQMSALIFKV